MWLNTRFEHRENPLRRSLPNRTDSAGEGVINCHVEALGECKWVWVGELRWWDGLGCKGGQEGCEWIRIVGAIAILDALVLDNGVQIPGGTTCDLSVVIRIIAAIGCR